MRFRRAFGSNARREWLCLGLGLALSLSQPLAALGQIVNPNATNAIGQVNLLSNILNQTGNQSLFFPYDIARDETGNGRYWVADAFNSRVIGYECSGANCSLPTFDNAERVFGQPDFASWNNNGGLEGGVSATVMSFPRGVAVGASGDLVVADTGNNRVLVFQGAWEKASKAADLVLGQATMSNASTGAGLNRMNAPEGVFVDAGGNVWVADTGNHRILKFTSPLATGQSAAFAIGGAGAPSATKLSGPTDVHVDGAGNLWVADKGFSRALMYPSPQSGGMAATMVFGHGGSFTNGSPNQGGVSEGSLAFPEKLYVDFSSHLWIADTGNHRVLQYNTPVSLDRIADHVFGQADRSQVPTFTTIWRDAPDGFPNAAGLFGPRGLLRDGGGDLMVCDRDNSRILSFDDPLGAPASARIVADRVLGKPSMVDASVNIPSNRRTNNPVGVAVDTSETPNRLWAVDIGNNRVLGYDSTDDVAHDRTADIVLGQPSFTTGATNAGINGPLQNAANAIASSSSLFFPFGVAVDDAGGVYVADTSNSRILHFLDPFSSGTTADRVFGQTNFINRIPKFLYGAADSLAGPVGVAVDAANNLWVADTLHHRLVRFDDAPTKPTTGGSADLILGQAGFVSSSTFPPYSPGCSINRMNAPEAVYATATRVYVADSGNHRVLVFASPFSNGMNASAVFGQASFNQCNANRGGAVSAATLNDPSGVWEDASGNVFIADTLNNRVLVYNTPFSGGNLIADQVIGQPNFTSTAVPSPGPNTLFQPTGLAMDEAENLFVGDRENSRVTRYSGNPSPAVLLDPIPSAIRVGDFVALTGSGFTAGSVVQFFVNTATGVQAFGPFNPFSWAPGFIFWQVNPTIPLGAGFGTVQIVNTDQGFIASNPQSQLVIGSPASNIPSILSIAGEELSAPDPSIPTAYVETVIAPGASITITGTGFNNPLLNFFTAAGNFGPITPTNFTSGSITMVVPPAAPTGPGSLQVVNSPYTGNVQSNAVSVVVGAPVSLQNVSQAGTTITVVGTGFSTASVINFFNRQGLNTVSLGGLNGLGNPNIPLTFVDETRFTFTVPAGAQSGAAYVQVLNPPFIPFTSSGNDPDGAFTLSVP